MELIFFYFFYRAEENKDLDVDVSYCALKKQKAI